MFHYLKVYQKFLNTDTEIFTSFLLFTLPESGKFQSECSHFFAQFVTLDIAEKLMNQRNTTTYEETSTPLHIAVSDTLDCIFHAAGILTAAPG